MGPTFPPKVSDNLSILQYEGVTFIFKYSPKEKQLEDGSRSADVYNLVTDDNNLSKIVIEADQNIHFIPDKRGKTLFS